MQILVDENSNTMVLRCDDEVEKNFLCLAVKAGMKLDKVAIPADDEPGDVELHIKLSRSFREVDKESETENLDSMWDVEVK